jgi:hypothetical protein
VSEVQRNDDGTWAVPIVGWEVTRCCVGIGFLLLMHGDDGRGTLKVGTECTISGGGETVTVDPEDDPAAVGRFTVFLREQVTSATATDRGRLEVRFAKGASLTVEPDPDYEAWGIATGSEGFRLVSMPGGDLAIWQPTG